MTNTLKKYLVSNGYLVVSEGLKSDNKIDEHSVSQLLLSFSSLGFRLDEKSIKLLKRLDEFTFTRTYNESIELLKQLVGDVKHIIFYKSFPNVSNLTSLEYDFNAILHYLFSDEFSYGYMPEETSDIKKDAEKYQRNTLVTLVTKKEATIILKEKAISMLEAKNVISEENLKVLEEIYKMIPNEIIPNEIPFKVNLANYIDIITENRSEYFYNALKIVYSSLKTITDVLRVYAVFSGSDAEVNGYVNFVSLPRKVRLLFMDKLDEICSHNIYAIDEAHSKEFLFKRAFEYLHVGEYSKTHPHIYKLAYELRSKDYQTFNSKIEEYISNKDEPSLLKQLVIKPGVFARCLDRVLRFSWINTDNVINAFNDITPLISSNVLISLYEHFANRNDLSKNSGRVIFYRQSFKYHTLEIPESRTEIDSCVKKRVISVILEGIKDKYKDKEKIEGVYVDPTLKEITLPTNNRNFHGGFNVLPFGSKLLVPDEIDKPVLRLFTYWQNCINGRVDIDLSVELFDEDYNFVTSLAWHNMTGGSFIDSYHSGDITTAPNGASEFIDVNIRKAKEKKIRYIVVCNSVFTGQSFEKIPNCTTGVMFRSNSGKRGKVYEAKTVETKFDLVSKQSNCEASFVFDTYENKLIYLNIPYNYSFSSVVASCRKNALSYLLQKATNKKLSLYDLILLHCKHITFTNNKSDAKYVIDKSKDSILDITNFEVISRDWI